MPFYEYRCQECREVFGEHRSMNEVSEPSCTGCGSASVNRIWNATIRTGGITPDVGQGASRSSSSSSPSRGGGCGSCSSSSCGTCH